MTAEPTTGIQANGAGEPARGQRLRVMMCTSSAERGGAEEHMLHLLRGLDRGQIELCVGCPGGLLAALSDLPADVRVFADPPRTPLDAWNGGRLARYVRRHGIDLVHTHLAFTSRNVAFWARLGGAPVVIETTHVREGWRRGWKRSYAIDRAFDRALDGYIAVSAANAAYLREEKRLPARKIRTILNGIELERFGPGMGTGADPRPSLGISPNESLIVCTARLEPQKGQAVLLRAFAALIQRMSLAGRDQARVPRLVCLGGGSCLADLQHLVRDLGIQHHVLFPGFCPRVEAWLNIADVFVLPSLYEGLPLAVAEAMASGCAVVATAVDGTPEMIEDGVNGLLVTSGDPDGLTTAMMRLLADPCLRQRLGAAAREGAARFDRRRQIAATAACYRELCQRAPRRAWNHQAGRAGAEAGARVRPADVLPEPGIRSGSHG